MIPALLVPVNSFSDEDSAEAPVFDPTRLKVLMELEDEGDHTMIKDIAQQFLEDITLVMTRLEPAIYAGDFAQVSSAAHTIKGSCATFGLYQVEKFARQLEACAKGGGKTDAVQIYDSLRSSFTKGSEALTAYLATK